MSNLRWLEDIALRSSDLGELSSDPTFGLSAPLLTGSYAVARITRLPVDFSMASQLVTEVISVSLTPAERSAWELLPAAQRRRRQWLLGRLAAKDAVRSLLLTAAGIAVRRSDIEVLAGRNGQPQATVRRPGAAAHPVLVSIAHSGNAAVAMVCEPVHAAGVGIDIEVVRARAGVERKGLTAAERARLDQLPPSMRTETVLRWWCAKEAAVKALGLGFHRSGGAHRIEVTPMRPDCSRLRVEIAAGTGRPARAVCAVTRREGDVVVATVVDAPSGSAGAHASPALRCGQLP